MLLHNKENFKFSYYPQTVKDWKTLPPDTYPSRTIRPLKEPLQPTLASKKQHLFSFCSNKSVENIYPDKRGRIIKQMNVSFIQVLCREVTLSPTYVRSNGYSGNVTFDLSSQLCHSGQHLHKRYKNSWYCKIWSIFLKSIFVVSLRFFTWVLTRL